MKMKQYTIEVSEYYNEDLERILKKEIDPDKWDLFLDELDKKYLMLDRDWEDNSKEMQYEPFSTYGYRKGRFHSVPSYTKKPAGWKDLSADYRIIFKVKEESGQIYLHRIGKRIKGFPKDPNDIYSLAKLTKVPEDE